MKHEGDRLDVFVCGGSQLAAASDLPPTAVVTAQLARRLRARLGAGRSRVHGVYCDVDPARLVGQLRPRLGGGPFAVVLIPRNFPDVDGLADAARRLLAPDLSLPVHLPAAVRSRWLAHGWYALWLATAPVRLLRWWRGLSRAAGSFAARGGRLFVVATPVPFPKGASRRGHAYYRLVSALLRRWRGPGRAVADLNDELAALGAPTRPGNPHHLTVEGHALAAATIAAALDPALFSNGRAGYDAAPPHPGQAEPSPPNEPTHRRAARTAPAVVGAGAGSSSAG
jgi:hypothetical protein